MNKGGFKAKLTLHCRITNNRNTKAEDEDEVNQRRGVAGVEELLDACRSMGANFLVCEMGLRALEITRDKLRDDIPLEQGGVVTFLTEATHNGSMVLI